MSPKKMTRTGLTIGAVSILGLIPMAYFDLNLGIFNWWPAIGLGLAVLLFVAAFTKGAYLTAQRRAEMVEMLDDCYRPAKPGGEFEARGKAR